MPSRNRDSGDYYIELIVGWFVGLLASAGLGYLVGKKQQQQIEQLEFQFPDVLEEYKFQDMDTLASEMPWQFKHFNIIRAVLIWVTISFGGLALMSLCNNVGMAIVPGLIAFGSYWGLKRLQEQKAEYLAPEQAPVDVEPLELSQGISYTIRLPWSAAQNLAAMGRFMEQLLVKTKSQMFQIVAEDGSVSWRILDVRGHMEPSVIHNVVHAFYPEAIIEQGPVHEFPFAEPFYRYLMAFKHSGSFLFPIRYPESLKHGDPLDNLTYEMGAIRPGERIVYTLFVAGPALAVYQQAEQRLTMEKIENPLRKFTADGMADAGFRAASGRRQERVSAYDSKDEEIILNKLTNVCFNSLLLIQIDAPTRERVADLSHIDSQIGQYRGEAFSMLEWYEETLPDNIQYINDADKAAATSVFGQLDKWLTNHSRRWQQFRLILDTRELASLWHLPDKAFASPAITWERSKAIPLPREVAELQAGVPIGTGRYAWQDQPVYMPDDARNAHMVVIGRTGIGKSTLLHNLIHHDIATGGGVAVIDPHGELVQHILETSIPEARYEDVVVWDLANRACPPPMNMLSMPIDNAGSRSGDDDHGDEVAASLITIFEYIYSQFETSQMAYTLDMVLQTLAVDETPTIRDVSRLFEDDDYRWRLVDRLQNEVVDDFWAMYDRRSDRWKDDLIFPVMRRLSDFYKDKKTLYPILCHPDRLDFRELIGQNKIILISLLPAPDSKLKPTEQNLLGALLVNQFYLAMQAGVVDGRYRVYIDEAQRFVATPVKQLFEEGRKFGFSMTLAHQYLKQLNGETLQAVMGTVGAMAVFQCETSDARAVGPYMKPSFEVDDLVQLDMYQVAMFMRVGPNQQPAFSLRTNPAPQADDPAAARAVADQIRELSRRKYTPKSREEVMGWLAERYPRRTRQTTGARGGDGFSEPV